MSPLTWRAMPHASYVLYTAPDRAVSTEKYIAKTSNTTNWKYILDPHLVSTQENDIKKATKKPAQVT